MKKQYPTDTITNELTGASVFFQPQTISLPEPTPASDAAVPYPVAPPLPVVPVQTITQDSTPASNQQPTQELLSAVHPDVTIDVTTSLLQDIDLKRWQELIENTETQNSSLRLTSEERYVIEDVISELQRKERIKTSMNEVARLGLLFLIHEFKKNGHTSLLYRVKKA